MLVDIPILVFILDLMLSMVSQNSLGLSESETMQYIFLSDIDMCVDMLVHILSVAEIEICVRFYHINIGSETGETLQIHQHQRSIHLIQPAELEIRIFKILRASA